MKKSLLTDVLTTNFAINSVSLALNKNNSSSEKKTDEFCYLSFYNTTL